MTTKAMEKVYDKRIEKLIKKRDSLELKVSKLTFQTISMQNEIDNINKAIDNT